MQGATRQFPKPSKATQCFEPSFGQGVCIEPETWADRRRAGEIAIDKENVSYAAIPRHS